MAPPVTTTLAAGPAGLGPRRHAAATPRMAEPPPSMMSFCLRQEAERTVAEAHLAHAEGAVEAGSVVLPRDRRGELGELRRREVREQRVTQLVRNLRGRGGHRRRQVEHERVELVEQVAVAVVRDGGELLV